MRGPQKAISAKFLYDAAGSALFDRICELEEYYPTRTETAILRARAGDIAAYAGRDVVLVEFGAGSGVKVRTLLNALDRPRAYLPIDISGDHMLTASAALAEDYSGLEVLPVVADFTQSFILPDLGGDRRLGFFPGSTIGNFEPAEAIHFLSDIGTALGVDASLVLGVDKKKDPHILHAAYNDREGITVAFNLNLLRRINRELNGHPRSRGWSRLRHLAHDEPGRLLFRPDRQQRPGPCLQGRLHDEILTLTSAVLLRMI